MLHIKIRSGAIVFFLPWRYTLTAPAKTNRIQKLDLSLGKLRRFTSIKKCPVPSLPLYPSSEGGIFPCAGDFTMTMDGLELFELLRKCVLSNDQHFVYEV